VASLELIQQNVVRRKIPDRRNIEDQRKATSARAAVEALERDGCEVYGLTKGQFSLADMIEAILEKTGPASLGVSTWTAANASIQSMMELLQSGRITGCRWLVDQTFVRRCPGLVGEIRRKFGADAIRVTKTHAKFVTITNDEWKVALRSSMNLNQNPRLESFEVGHDPQLCAFLEQVLDDVWKKQRRDLIDTTSSAGLSRWFNERG
jgi:hypothetical protein